MTTFCLSALLCLAQGEEGLSIEKPEGWERRENAQAKMVFYVPPNVPAGKQCVLMIFAPQEIAATAEAYHDQQVKGASQGMQAVSEIKTGSVGSFRASGFAQQTPQGIVQLLGVYTARWGGRGQTVIFVSTDEELFKTHVTKVLAAMEKVALPGGDAPEGTALSGLLVPLPKGWTWKNDPSGWINVIPPAELGATDARILVGARPVEKTHWGAHRKLLKEFMDAAKFQPALITSDPGPGPFISSLVTSATDTRTVRLYTALVAADRMETVVAIYPIFGSFSSAFVPIMERTTLKDPAPPARRPEVVEAYRRAAMKQYLNADGSSFYGKVKYERILLLSNGVADLRASYEEGFGACPGIAKLDADCLSGYYGAWKAEGKQVQLTREAGKEAEVYEREDGSLRRGDQVWKPMPRVDGLRLSGRYSYKSAPGVPISFNYWVEFTEEGAFKTEGLLPWLALTDTTGRPKPPEKASGTYELRDWTIWFKVDGRAVWSTDFMTVGEDPKDLSIILLQTYGFKRE